MAQLQLLVDDLDRLFELATAAPDIAMSRHVPRVYAEAGVDWRRWATPEFATRFNGLMIRGRDEVGQVFAACFPSTEILEQWLALARPGDLLITHHPIDVRNGHPDGRWAEGFVPIGSRHLAAITGRGLSVYAVHAPMDTSLEVGTAAAIVEALGGTVCGRFWPYGNGFAGLLCRVPPLSSAELVGAARRIFKVDLVEVAGPQRAVIERIAVVGGIGDRVSEMTAAEELGAQAWLTGEIHVRIEGEYGRRKHADVRDFADRTTMTLVGVSHAASEQLVLRTQLTRWLAARHGLSPLLLDEPRWWR
ncbi:Nif3-like dinuclear metal center hexameric protein [Actinoplanes sp. ATCC 53533]|uniref:Nif3-like dinuclear metal center hexameric protein n=1 Tax=Actinoplanes sp. ATCC 53533 TaxID=1288362 RepID=UPI0013154E32|nr:Nif3-like dinuclear metal center hexameric protein [Actinoplanes sp. ATCC 53533]